MMHVQFPMSSSRFDAPCGSVKFESKSYWSDNSGKSSSSEDLCHSNEHTSGKSCSLKLPSIRPVLPLPRLRTTLPSINTLLKDTGDENASLLVIKTLQEPNPDDKNVRVVICKNLSGKNIYGHGFPKNSLWVLKIHPRSTSASQEGEIRAYIRLADARRRNSEEVGLKYIMSSEATFCFDNYCALVTPLALCDLRRYLDHISECEVPEFMTQITIGIATLHKFGIVHGDIKPENILIGFDRRVKITDFGGSFVSRMMCPVQTGFTYPEITYTEGYCSPERIDKSKIGVMVDWWAFGCVFYEMVMKAYYPVRFRDDSDVLLFERIHIEDWEIDYESYQMSMHALSLHAPMPSYYSYRLLLGLLHPDPWKRFTMADMVDHPYFVSDSGESYFKLLELDTRDATECKILLDVPGSESAEVIRPDLPNGTIFGWINPTGSFARPFPCLETQFEKLAV